MRVSVGIPVYDGKIPAQLASCLLAETLLAFGQGHLIEVLFLESCGNITLGRNQLVKQFLESKSDRLVFVDADLTFVPGSVIRIAQHPVDFVGGAYRVKLAHEGYPIAPLPHSVLAGPGQLVEVATVPTGFLSLSRNVFDTFRAHHGDRAFSTRGALSYAYFQTPYRDGALYTEDAYFCREYREAGGRVYLDPELALTHWGAATPFVGHIGNYIRANRPKSAERTA